MLSCEVHRGLLERLCEEGESAMMITLTEEDLVRLTAIQVDRDAQEALAFILERILPEVQRQQNSRLKGHLDGGKGSLR